MSGRRLQRRSDRAARRIALPVVASLTILAAFVTAGAIHAGPTSKAKAPVFKNAKAFDVSKPLRELAKSHKPSGKAPKQHPRGNVDRNLTIEGASASELSVAGAGGSSGGADTLAVGPTIANFEGLSNQDNFNVFGFRVNPPDPVGDVGPNHYVEMINLVFAVYSKTGTKLLGPLDSGTLWDGFPIEDCTDPSGDPIVVYDQFADRWLLSQFTTRGLDDPTLPFYNCVAVSVTGDPTGAYYRYAFITQEDPDGGYYFPDYPKYGVWKDSYVLTTRDFGSVDGYGISIYALDRNKMLNGEPAGTVQFFLDAEDPAVNLYEIGDGLLPADVDGKTKPKQDVPIPIIGTQDDDGGYGATSDALNIYELDVHWNAGAEPDATLSGPIKLPTAAFDSAFPCTPTARDCLPQPGIANPAQFLDILSYRQRPTWRLAWRGFKGYDSMVTTQSVEAAPAVAGMRWYEVRRNAAGTYSIHQQGTYAPGDGVHRWMGSIAQDKNGAMALGYSVVNGTTVYPGIRYTGRVAADPLGTMPQGEGVVINGSGVQTTTNSRWGDYTSMNVDPVDDCTFWYVNEYYTAAGQASSPAGWQTRIASFKLPGC